MKSLRTLHIYGSVRLESDFCPDCQQQAFVRSVRMSCCGRPAPQQPWEQIKVEIDAVGKRRRKPPIADRKAILAEQENCCIYCGDEFNSWRTLEGERCCVRLQWDHVVPFSYDGNNHEFVAACSVCNAHKYNLHFSTLDEAREYLQLKMHEKKTRTAS